MHWLGLRDVLTLGGVIPQMPPSDDHNDALDRGIRIHHLTRLWDEGQHVEPAPDIIGPAEGYQRFLAEVQPTWTAIEQRLEHHALKIRGRIDRRGLIFGHPAMVDIAGKHPQAWHGPRLWGYWMLGGCRPDERRYAVYLSDGTYKLKEFTDHHGDMQKFFEAIRRARFVDYEYSGPPLGDDDD